MSIEITKDRDMPPIVRPAAVGDIPRMIELLLIDAIERQEMDAILWRMAGDAAAQIEKALLEALTPEKQPFLKIWHVAENEGEIVGVAHAMLLPVPPIYAGALGEPGLILPDTTIAPEAPEETIDALMGGVEQALQEAGAKIILSSFVTGKDWQNAFHRRGYKPLTLYLSRTGIGDGDGDGAGSSGTRPATSADVPGIVDRSVENRQIKAEIDPFWQAHSKAEERFSAWMHKSLTLDDRDMLVTGATEDLTGYVIAQPASRLHFPPAHDISGTGVIDDYYHTELADPQTLASGSDGATALLHAAEDAFARRGLDAAFVVCPAGWRSKINMLNAAGYKTAMVWSIKRL